jgi:hypothetical protein
VPTAEPAARQPRRSSVPAPPRRSSFYPHLATGSASFRGDARLVWDPDRWRPMRPRGREPRVSHPRRTASERRPALATREDQNTRSFRTGAI